MTKDALRWEMSYRQEGDFVGPPPWNIGEAQPELATLIRDGKFRSDVLDAGCGVGDLAITLAAAGHTVVGVDLSSTAIAMAKKTSRARNLGSVTFEQADLTTMSNYVGYFNTVVDSALYHSMPPTERDGYLRSVYLAAAPDATFFMLVRAKTAASEGNDSPTKPNEVDERELYEAVSKYWNVEQIRPAVFHAYVPNLVGVGPLTMPFDRDDQGRVMFPAFLLTAHKSIRRRQSR